MAGTRFLSAWAGFLCITLAACQTRGVVGYPAEFISTRGPTHVWVTQPDNSVVELSNPQIHGDTLVGFSEGTYIEMPLSDVKLMKASFPAPARTAIVAGASAIGLALAVAALMGNASTTTCYDRTTGGTMPCLVVPPAQ
jgi:hypothetical protein